MPYKLLTTHQFEKDLKRCKKRGLPMDKLKEVINELVAKGKVSACFKPHILRGNNLSLLVFSFQSFLYPPKFENAF